MWMQKFFKFHLSQYEFPQLSSHYYPTSFEVNGVSPQVLNDPIDGVQDHFNYQFLPESHFLRIFFKLSAKVKRFTENLSFFVHPHFYNKKNS